MICVQCGTENAEQRKYCSQCNALLFKVAPDGLPSSSTMDLDENIEYPVAQSHYQSPLLESLAWAVHDFAEDEGDLEPVVETYEAYREVYETFSREVPALQEVRYCADAFFDNDPVPKLVKYCLDRAVESYKKGEALFEGYLESLEALGDEEAFPDPEPLKEGTRCWLDCNDNICMTFELLTGQIESLTELIEACEEHLAEGGSENNEQPVEENAEA